MPDPDTPAPRDAASRLQALLAVALVAAVLLNVVNVASRYGLGRSIQAADELQIYLLVALAFLGSVVASRRDAHLRMDVLAARLPRAGRRLLAALERLLTLLLCGFLTVVSAQYAWRVFQLGSHSENAGIPMWIPHAVLPLAFGLMTLAALRPSTRSGGVDEAPAAGADERRPEAIPPAATPPGPAGAPPLPRAALVGEGALP